VAGEGSGHGGRALAAVADGIARRTPVNSGSGGVWACEGVRPRSCCSYKRGRGALSSMNWSGRAGGHGSARARGQACTGASAAVEHVALCICPCSNAHRLHILTYLGKITI
jgi:hypothetical protein